MADFIDSRERTIKLLRLTDNNEINRIIEEVEKQIEEDKEKLKRLKI